MFRLIQAYRALSESRIQAPPNLRAAKDYWNGRLKDTHCHSEFGCNLDVNQIMAGLICIRQPLFNY